MCPAVRFFDADGHHLWTQIDCTNLAGADKVQCVDFELRVLQNLTERAIDNNVAKRFNTLLARIDVGKPEVPSIGDVNAPDWR